jgi:DNA-binding beta-propeller fold protein YncE
MLPDLERLERKYEQELVIIGVHSGKFPTEQAKGGLKEAVLRNQITHPNVNDPEFKIWERYGARAWPTIATIDPEGRVVDFFSGEGRYDRMDRVMQILIREGEAKGTLKRGKLETLAPESRVKPGVLMYPGKICAADGRLYISDTNHHRIVVAKPDGAVIETIGSGAAGFKDGPAAEAQFRLPQGLWADGAVLYVADTENHRIRAVDLKEKRVATIAGNEQRQYSRGSARPPLETPLNSPWDVLVEAGQLYIAMAGNHQIWKMDLKAGTIDAYAGAGPENIRDGPLMRALFSQPSGLAAADGIVYVADAEDSAIRAIDPAAQRVKTLVGTGLFDFGDRDGIGTAAMLQHPLAVAAHEGALWIADAYNHRIKRLDLKTLEVKSVFGSGKVGLKDGVGTEAEFAEPAGLAILEGKLYVADVNNHAVRVCDPASRSVQTLVLRR